MNDGYTTPYNTYEVMEIELTTGVRNTLTAKNIIASHVIKRHEQFYLVVIMER